MGLRGVGDFLRRHRTVALDTSIFIYHLEDNARYAGLTADVFDWLERPGHGAVTSTVTMTELLVLPYRESDVQQVNEFYALLYTCPNLEWIAPSLPIADTAARVRAEHRLRTPDALQAATAIHSGATALVTNYQAFEKIKEFETLVLERLL